MSTDSVAREVEKKKTTSGEDMIRLIREQQREMDAKIDRPTSKSSMPPSVRRNRDL